MPLMPEWKRGDLLAMKQPVEDEWFEAPLPEPKKERAVRKEAIEKAVKE